jgi:hypothetical protein
MYDDIEERRENTPYRKLQRQLKERERRQMELERKMREYETAGNKRERDPLL